MQNYFNQRGHNRINIIETVISGKDVEKPGNNKCVLAQSCLTLSHLVAQSCPTHCDLRDCSWPDSSVHGIFHVILEYSTGVSPALAGRFFTTDSPDSLQPAKSGWALVPGNRIEDGGEEPDYC